MVAILAHLDARRVWVHPLLMRQGTRVFWVAVVSSLAAAGQTPPEPCRVEGAVVNAITGQPVRKARLMLTPVKSGAPVTGATDAQGKYVLANLAPGAYRLQVSHDGYQAQAYGARKPGEDHKGDTLDLTPGSVKTKVDLQMTPLGAILGHIRDESGDLVRQVEVAVLAYGHGPEGKVLQMRSSSQTDATGEYRIFDLPPGRYYLRAKPQSSQMPAMAQVVGESYATTFYPNATQPTEAAAIDLAAGQEQRGLDFVLRPISTASIRGRVAKPAGGENCTAALEGFGDGTDLYVNDIFMGSASREVFVTSAPGGGSGPGADVTKTSLLAGSGAPRHPRRGRGADPKRGGAGPAGRSRAAGRGSPSREAGVASAVRAGAGAGADRRVHGGRRRRAIPARGSREEGCGCRAGAGGPGRQAAGHRG